MNKKEFFIQAMKADCYRRTAWVISAFSLIAEGPDEWKSDPYKYRIVQTPTGHFFVDPDNSDNLIQIEGTEGGKPVFQFKDSVHLENGDAPNLAVNIESTYGTLLANYILLVYPFGSKISYANGKIKADKLKSLILKHLKSVPEEGQPRDPKAIYVDEYLKYADATFYIVAFTQLCVPGVSRKSTTAPPGVKELRAKLLEENKDRLHDPAVIAKIEAELVAYLKDYLKGDSSMGFLLKKKSLDVVRKKLFLMGGAETGMEDRVNVDLVVNSLSEGVDLKNFHVLNTASRSGSYSRGAQTELGGEAVKWLFRASSNLTVKEGDCGTKMGLEFFAKPGEEHKLLGFTALIEGQNVKITDENVGQYMGKRVLLRSPMFCRLPKTDYCEMCLSDRLANSPTGLSTAVAEYGSRFMLISMSAMHGKVLEVGKMDLREVLM